MPTTKKRVNLTLTDDVYDKLQEYKKKNGITNDASACLQLVVKQLQAQDMNEQILRTMQGLTLDQLKELSTDGLSYLKSEVEKGK